jgi:hypothetical protein
MEDKVYKWDWCLETINIQRLHAAGYMLQASRMEAA